MMFLEFWKFRNLYIVGGRAAKIGSRLHVVGENADFALILAVLGHMSVYIFTELYSSQDLGFA